MRYDTNNNIDIDLEGLTEPELQGKITVMLIITLIALAAIAIIYVW